MKSLLRRMKRGRLRWFASGFGEGLASAAESYSAFGYRNLLSSVQNMRSDLRQALGREKGEESAQNSRQVAEPDSGKASSSPDNNSGIPPSPPARKS